MDIVIRLINKHLETILVQCLTHGFFISFFTISYNDKSESAQHSNIQMQRKSIVVKHNTYRFRYFKISYTDQSVSDQLPNIHHISLAWLPLLPHRAEVFILLIYV